ncbi:restriction endonuclease subunit S [Bacteroides mediterraneensis]|uniref:Restriction endonuclease subunit S n=1 Tax=Bacteroides mediterraneensis TaxID=1841856 RepID=A0ABS2ETY2_9BACE|nr:restriction endonuclease subunit S [Bacteroides mediterraneensis]MBM6758137.1 restriction endonuclease subunit S [Bacteroides mediterraneensis]
MSKENYRRLGDYIREVDVRNRDLEVKELLGINIGKYFMPSVANVVGTDLSNYKIVYKNQFACNLMHVGRDEKIPIAILDDFESAIVSPAYFTFEISDYDVLLPQYLMMWFRKPEFDREAWFYTDGDVRGGMSKSALLDMSLPVPPIEQQRKIVAEYEAVSRKIRLNERMITRLEETAQTLYRKMFVDGIDKENLPEGWRMGTLGEITEMNTDNISSKDSLKEIKYFDSSSVTQNIFDKYQLFNTLIDEIPSRAKRKVKYNDIIYSTVRPNLRHYGILKDKKDVENVVVSTAFAVIRSCHSDISNELLYLMLTDERNTEHLQGIAEMSKATYPAVTPEDIMSLKVFIPKESTDLNNTNRILKYCFDFIYLKHQENVRLQKFQSLFLSNLGQ